MAIFLSAGLINAATTVLVLGRITEKWTEEKRKIIMYLWIFGWTFLVGVLKAYLASRNFLFPLFYSIGLVCVMWRAGKLSVKRSIFCMWVLLCISLASDFATIFVPQLVTETLDWNSLSGPGYLLAVVFSDFIQILIVCIYWLIGKVRKKKDRAPAEKESWTFPVIIVILELLILLWSVAFGASGLLYTDFICFCFISCIGAIFLENIWLILQGIREDDSKALAQRLKRMEEKSRLSYEHYKKLEASYEKLHHFRHDFRNELDTACGAMWKGDLAVAEKLCGQMEQMLKEV